MSEVVQTLSTLETTHNYSRGADILNVAAHAWGIEISSEQRTEWQHLIRAAFILDGILDSEQDENTRVQAYDQTVSYMVGDDDLVEPDPSIQALHQLIPYWPAAKLERMVDVASRMKELAFAKREASSARVLGKLAILEGDETARLLRLEQHQSQREYFNVWLETLLRFGVVVDSAGDLPKDHHKGIVMVPPSRRNQLIIASHASASLVRLTSRTPVALYSSLFSAARAMFQD